MSRTTGPGSWVCTDQYGADAGRCRRVQTGQLRRSFNNAFRKQTSGIVTRAIVGHVSEEMTEHYSHVDQKEKLEAAAGVARAVLGGAPLRGGSSGGSERRSGRLLN